MVDQLYAAVKARGTEGMAGIWTDEHQLIKAAHRLREAGFVKFDAITPFPLHEIDEAIGIPRSYIPWVTFVFGFVGLAFGLWFTWWTSAYNWPIIVGGKPMWSLPAFIPVVFECVILFAALSSVGALIFSAGLPKVDPPVIDPDLTSHKFALFVPHNDKGYDEAKIQQIFQDLGADEIKRTEF